MYSENMGISHIEIMLPEKRMRVEDMAKQLGENIDQLQKDIGIKQKPICENDQDIIQLATQAAANLIKNNDIDPSTIDLIIYASCGIQAKQLWSPAANIQKTIQANNAFAFDIQNGCNSGNLALEIARQLLTDNPSKNKALIVVGDALSTIVDYSNPLHKCIFSFSDAASALLVCKQTLQNNLLAFSASTEALFADSMYIQKNQPHVWLNDDAEEDEALIKAYEKRYQLMIETSLIKIGKTITDIKHIVMNQGDHKLINKLAKNLGISHETIFRSHENYGHLGGTDIFFGLKTLIDTQAVASGDLVVLASSAIGFSWGASIIRI